MAGCLVVAWCNQRWLSKSDASRLRWRVPPDEHSVDSDLQTHFAFSNNLFHQQKGISSMFKRKPAVVRRTGHPLLQAATFGSASYLVGQSAAKSATSEAAQEARQNQPAQPSARPGFDRLEKLYKLGELHNTGVLTDAEFDSEKQKVLSEA
jgi:hypothetical protein